MQQDVQKEPSGLHVFGLNGLPGLCPRSSNVAIMGEADEEGGVAMVLVGLLKSNMAGVADSFVAEEAVRFRGRCGGSG